MPIYEYACMECEVHFEELVRSSEQVVTCPSCGRMVDPGGARAAESAADDDLGPIPWHLKLLAGALAVYLGYRAYQGIEWVAHQL